MFEYLCADGAAVAIFGIKAQFNDRIDCLVASRCYIWGLVFV